MGRRPKVVTVMVKTNPHDHYLYKIQMNELERLLDTLGYAPVYRMIQVRPKPTVNYVLGRGKVEELKEKVRQLEPELVAFYNTLSSKQKWNLERALNVEVVDRYEVTLRIFREAASDVISKLQIDLATLSKALPYIKLAASKKYLRMRAGFLGGGEYAYHRAVNAVQRRMKILRRKIEKLERQKLEQVRKRIEAGGKIVVITGYYNAGKTSLFNALTGMEKPVSPQPFTTLSSKYAALLDGRVYLVDTIGFVLDLDPRLIHSFRLNVIDMQYSQLALLVVDVSEKPEIAEVKISECLRLLRELEKETEDLLVVFNKADLVDEETLRERVREYSRLVEEAPHVVVSAKTGRGLDQLVRKMARMLEERVAIPPKPP